MSGSRETYLGDGLFASFDGYRIWLRTLREDGIHHRIALEPLVFNALLDYAIKIVSAANAAEAGGQADAQPLDT
jgi:hypothetical protein